MARMRPLTIMMIAPGTIVIVTTRATLGDAFAAWPADLLGALAPHLGRNVPQGLSQRNAQLLGLEELGDETAHRLRPDALAHRQERVPACHANRHLPQRGLHLLRKRPGVVLSLVGRSAAQ